MTALIKFTNNSISQKIPQVFVTAQNEISDFNTIADGIAWRVLKKIGHSSIATFTFSSNFTIRAGWDNGDNLTKLLEAKRGVKYAVLQNSTGIVLEQVGSAAYDDVIELENRIHSENGILAQLYNENKIIMGKKVVGFNQSAIFKPAEKLYWGLASEINEGNGLSSSSAVLNTSQLFELDLRGLSEVSLSLNGNPKEGFRFKIDKQI